MSPRETLHLTEGRPYVPPGPKNMKVRPSRVSLDPLRDSPFADGVRRTRTSPALERLASAVSLTKLTSEGVSGIRTANDSWEYRTPWAST